MSMAATTRTKARALASGETIPFRLLSSTGGLGIGDLAPSRL